MSVQDTFNSAHVKRYSHNELFRLLDDVVLGLGLPDAVHRTAQLLIRFIPSDAPAPVSPVRVQELAELRHVDARTVRAHIQRLIAYGLAEDSSLGNGHRCVRRRANRIIALHGIDLSPMLSRADELRALAAEVQHEQERRIALRADISALRRRFRLGRGDASAELLERFAALPRRYAHLPLADLAAIRERLLALLAACQPVDAVDAGTVVATAPSAHPSSSDQPEIRGRPNSSEEIRNPIGADVPPPSAWLDARERGDQRSSSGLDMTVRARSSAVGVPRDAWDGAVGVMRWRRAAPRTLSAKAPGIRCPTAWRRALASRTERRPNDLAANLYHSTSRRIPECTGPTFPC